MVTLQTFGDSAIKFTFLNNALYLNNGEITAPLNSLMLVIDDSGLATFKKLNGDPFVSVSYADLGMDKDELEQWYKDNMVGGNGLPADEIQDMIDASISGYDEDIQDEIGEKEQVIAIALTELKNDKLDVSAYTPTDLSEYWTSGETQSAINAAVSGYADSVEYNSTTKYVNFYHGGTGGTVVYSFNAAPFVLDGMVQNVVISGGSLVISFNTDAGKQDISIPLTEIFDPTNYYDKTATDAAINAATSGKADTSAVTAYSAATDARLDEDEEVTAAALNALEDELANKQDTLIAGSGITISGNVISAEGGSITIDPSLNSGSTNAVANSAITTALSGKADTSAVTEAIDAATSGKVDTTAYTAYTAATDAALSGKQDTLSAGTNITISGNVISAEGGGKSVTGGTNISVTTGETADTVSCKIPYSDVIYYNSDIILGKEMPSVSDYNRVFFGKKIASIANASLSYSIGIGVPPSSNSSDYNELYGSQSIGIGGFKIGNGSQYSNLVSGCVAIGYGAKTRISGAVAIGRNTEASGTTKTNINNQITVDTSNQVYIYNKDNTEMICLQDHLGGGSITIDPSLDSGSTNAVANSAITAAVSGKQDTLVSGTNIKTINNESLLGSGNITIGGGGTITIDPSLDSGSTNAVANSAITTALSGKADTSAVTEAIDAATSGKVETSAITTSITSGSTDSQVSSAKAVYNALGGLRIVKLTQQEYDAMEQGGTLDNSTLYVVI